MRAVACMTVLIVVVATTLMMPASPQSTQAQQPSAQVVRSVQAESRQATIRAQGPFRGPLRKTPPDQPRIPRLHEHASINPPADPTVRYDEIRPSGRETAVIPLPPVRIKPQAAETFTIFRNTALANSPTVGSAALSSSTTNEPSVGSNGRVVFWTENWYAAVSGDAGQTFSYVNPFDNFPADGTNDAVNGGFCCDQIVYYERTRGLMIWLLQYSADNTTNTQRLAIARSQQEVLNNTWTVYDVSPATFGFTTPPAGAAGFWLDFPDLTVSSNFLYLTTNVFPRIQANPTNPCAGTCPRSACPGPPTCPTGCTNPCTSTGAVIARIPLNDLAAAAPSIGINFYTDTNSGYRCAHGALNTMYWGSHNSNTQIRIYRWPENSGTVSLDDVNHEAFTMPTATTPMTATSPDGTNFAANTDTRVLGAWVARGVIGFMWNAAQGGGYPYPHVWISRYNESDRVHIDDLQVWSGSVAFLYPSVEVNNRQHIGGTMAWGGNSEFPHSLAWISDDLNNHTLEPLENFTFAIGNAGPASNRWGDYLTARVNVPYGSTWVGTGYNLTGGTGNANTVPRFVWFGRERDAPPATNTIYVNKENTTRHEDGTATHPYNTVTEGNFAAMPGDTIVIRSGNYPETVEFKTPVRVGSEGGTVKVGAQ